jgi:hypothetical protein
MHREGGSVGGKDRDALWSMVDDARSRLDSLRV